MQARSKDFSSVEHSSQNIEPGLATGAVMDHQVIGSTVVDNRISGNRVFDDLYIQNPGRWLATIMVAYLIVASLFAFETPAWQAPDEPAHFNYIEHIAQGNGLPILQAGDYDQLYNDWIKNRGFPADVSVAPMRYESYQPPLYYLTAVPIYWLGHWINQSVGNTNAHADGLRLALRLYDLFLGGLSLLLLYWSIAVVFPTRPLISLGATAFAGLLPMHVAMLASINNDSLAELLVTATLLLLLRWMRLHIFGRIGNSETAVDGSQHRRERDLLLMLGFILGLGLLTKIYAYALLPVCLLIVGLIVWLQPAQAACSSPERRWIPTWASFGEGIRQTLTVLLPALLLGLPMWLRNAMLYGPFDLLGLSWHDQVVVGQPTTSGWIATNGWIAYWERAITLTFQSFWGVFGWLGVFMDERVYMALNIFSGVLFFGLLWTVARLITETPNIYNPNAEQMIGGTLLQRWALGTMVLVLAVVFGSYLLYNLKFVQHQGRYLFWGLLPISTFVALGWREVLRPLQGLITSIISGTLAVSLTIIAALGYGPNKWTLLSIGIFAALLLLQPLLLIGTAEDKIHSAPVPTLHIFLSRPWLQRLYAPLRTLVWATPFICLFVLNIVAVYWYILPQIGE